MPSYCAGIWIHINSPPAADLTQVQKLLLTFLPFSEHAMHVVASSAPTGTIDPAPLTSLPIHIGMEGGRTTAFWSSDDQYWICVEGPSGTAWYQIETEASEAASDDATRLALGALMADILPLGVGRIAFPVGSSGRRVYRVWRASSDTPRSARTRIRGVLAGRSRRRPA
jgi:hypothetical protein